MSKKKIMQSAHSYRVEEDGRILTPEIKNWNHSEEEYVLTFWMTTFRSHFEIQNEFIFVFWGEYQFSGQDERYYFLLTGATKEELTQEDLLQPEHSVQVTPTKEVCGPAIQIRLQNEELRWLFPHPDGQRAAWEHLQSTTSEDDALRLVEISEGILANNDDL